MLFTVIISDSSYKNITTCQRFITACISRNNKIKCIYFKSNSVLQAHKNIYSPKIYQQYTAWQEIINNYNQKNNTNLKLLLCSSDCNDNGINEDNIHPEFSLSGMGEISTAILEADRVIKF